jgi:hypothetical protein
MTALRHIYWKFSCPSGEVDYIDEERLSKLLSYAPNLISLSMACARVLEFPISIRSTIPLTSLTKVECCKNTKQPVLFNNDIPNLTHIVTTADALKGTSPKSVLSMTRQQLKVIEFLDEWSFRGLFSGPVVSILHFCPKVDTLKYGVNYDRFRGASEMPHLSQRNLVLHESLRNIVLRISPRKEDDEVLLERCLAQHFDVLTGVAFPALRRVVLEGVVDRDAPFQQAYDIMCRRFPVQRIDGKDIVWER